MTDDRDLTAEEIASAKESILRAKHEPSFCGIQPFMVNHDFALRLIAQLERAQAILRATLREVPVGYDPGHTVERLPVLVADIAKSLGKAGIENDRYYEANRTYTVGEKRPPEREMILLWNFPVDDGWHAAERFRNGWEADDRSFPDSVSDGQIWRPMPPAPKTP